jgi:hypothetical protein
MAIDQTDVVDFIGIDPRTDAAILYISDHLEWTEDDQSDKMHMFLLQEKINAYLRFIESGEIFQSYPKASGREILIKVLMKYPLSHEAEILSEKIRTFLFDAGHKIEFEHSP